MKKNVCITIKSTQTVDQDKDSTELFTFGAMESTENGFRLYYDESEATGFAGSSVTLEVTDEEIYLKYTLDINSSYMSENEMFINVKECN